MFADRLLSFQQPFVSTFALTFFYVIYINEKKMKTPNYDPDFLTTTHYKQGHPCMPIDVFRMLICGPSNSGETNILLHMLYELLEYDNVYLFFKKPPPKQISGAFT